MFNHLNPVTVINENGKSDWLLVCEHASNTVPDSLHQLGLSASFFAQHIAYDIGAYEMTLALSEQLDATAIICNYSRLVIDCNRVLKASDCIPPKSDSVIIPGNQELSYAQRLQRINGIYRPFHRCVADKLAAKLAANPKTKFANIHSFTPVLTEEGMTRPWEIGFIYRLGEPTQDIIRHIRKHTAYLVGDNEPYNGFVHRGYTVPAHADAQEIPSFLVEFRQDLIQTAQGIQHWADILISALHSLKP